MEKAERGRNAWQSVAHILKELPWEIDIATSINRKMAEWTGRDLTDYKPSAECLYEAVLQFFSGFSAPPNVLFLRLSLKDGTSEELTAILKQVKDRLNGKENPLRPTRA